MATLFQQGGWMMWPLLALSVLALTVICERALFYGSLGFPLARQDEIFHMALINRDVKAIGTLLPVSDPVFGPYFGELRKFCHQDGSGGGNEEALDILSQEIANRLDARLPLLGIIVRVAPLMGLLGTVLGMINTFSRLAQTQGGVDLMVLAEGIWQALLTTAAGLFIAIPALLIQHGFISRKKHVFNALYRTSSAVFALCATQSKEHVHAA
jgi:biopolymer transport protein ExbB